MAVHTLFGVNGNGATGPAASAYSGPYQAGVIFQVTSGGQWLDGYWWWVASSGQQVTPVSCALWQSAAGPVYTLVPNSSVTSGTLTAGQWNYIPLAAPIALSQNVAYTAVVAYQSTTGFPQTLSQFGSGQPYAAGITNGPLSAYSDSGGSAPPPASQNQGLFGTGSSTVNGTLANSNYPNLGSDLSSNFWADVQIDSSAPAGASYQLFPSQPDPINQALDTASNFTLGCEFTLSQACTLNAIAYYSPPTVTQLPTECGIYLVSNQSLVAGTHLTSPSWSGAAGSGWVTVSYAGVVLPAGDYKAAVFNGAGSPAIWNAQTGPNYWQSPGPGANGIVNGPLSAPNNATAASPGQSTYHLGTPMTWPDTHQAGAYNYWISPVVTPLSSGLLMASGII